MGFVYCRECKFNRQTIISSKNNIKSIDNPKHLKESEYCKMIKIAADVLNKNDNIEFFKNGRWISETDSLSGIEIKTEIGLCFIMY